jgi:hypothetical protein
MTIDRHGVFDPGFRGKSLELAPVRIAGLQSHQHHDESRGLSRRQELFLRLST